MIKNFIFRYLCKSVSLQNISQFKGLFVWIIGIIFWKQ